MDLTIILTIGKYAILVAIYAFVLVVFRGIIRQLAAESKRGAEAASVAPERSRRTSRRRRRSRPAPEAPPRLKPQPSAPASEPVVEPAPAPEPDEEPEAEPAGAPALRPPAERPARIDLLSEPEEFSEAQPQAAPEPLPQAPADAEPPAVQERAAPHLLVLESGDEDRQAGEMIPLSAAVTIGRSEENSLQVSDRFVSSRHALLCLRDGNRILVDRGSTNGTFVNGARVEDEVELSDGDRIALGNTVLEYHAGS